MDTPPARTENPEAGPGAGTHGPADGQPGLKAGLKNFAWRERRPPGSRPGLGERLRGLSVPRIRPITALSGALALVWLVIGGWFMFASDPLGGEPMAIADIPLPESHDTALAAKDSRGMPVRTENALGDPTLQVTRSQDNGAGIITISDPLAGPVFDDDLIERTRYGPLPIIAETGRRSYQAYAVAPSAENVGKPRIALILTGMGLSASGTDAAIRSLPGAVTFAFAPYGRDIARLSAAARRDGHEILLQVPLEPFDYPDNDPGPHTLLTSIPARQNIGRLHWVMGRLTGYVGMINHMGARYASNAEALRPALEEIRNRGLIYVDDGAVAQSRAQEIAQTIGLPAQVADVVIDADPSRAGVNEALDRLAALAKDRGHAVGVATGLPVTLQALRPWLEDLENRGISLVPITAMIDSGGA
jgi:polysaccharide deacetylase 2 family uncharacterized protein YibQ